MRTIWTSPLLATALSVGLAAQPPARPSPIPALEPGGPELYRTHCASCHGLEGKGDGPVVESLRMRPGDLTLLTAKAGGTFPEFRVRRLLGGMEELPVHGSRKMPVWGPGLDPAGLGAKKAQERIDRLVAHLKSIQKAAAAPK